MLIVFAISITPTIVFHNWLVDHTDTIRKSSAKTSDQIDNLTFNCQCDHFVAESAFTEPCIENFTGIEQIFASHKADKPASFLSSAHICYSLRGPPAV